MTQQFTANLTLNLITDVLNTPRSVSIPAITPADVVCSLSLYRKNLNAWIKNVALNAPMGHAVFNEGMEGEVTYSHGTHGYYTCECSMFFTCELHGNPNDWYDKRSNRGML